MVSRPLVHTRHLASYGAVATT